MWWKKKETPAPEIKFECNHKYKDFPWYATGAYWSNRHVEVINIYEPYVCIHCKKRINKLLYSVEKQVKNKKEADDIFDEIFESYGDKIADTAIVEDMINDFQLVDREYLDIARKIFPNKGL